jgi:hypothetical protein
MPDFEVCGREAPANTSKSGFFPHPLSSYKQFILIFVEWNLMPKPLMKWACFFLVLSLFIPLFGCSPARPTADPNLIWAVSLLKFEVKEKLEGITTVTQYNGTKYDEFHQQNPAEGNVYLLLKLSVDKQVTGSASFDWNQLTIQDSAGNIYSRHSDDSFLELFQYTPRLPGVALKLGDNEGWVCYEIPKQAADGRLRMVFDAEGSQQEIVVKK